MKFNKRKQREAEKLLTSILELDEKEAYVVRLDKDSILFASNAAKTRMRETGLLGSRFKLVCNALFPELLKKYAELAAQSEEKQDYDPFAPLRFDTEDLSENIVSVSIGLLEWIDGEDALAIIVNNVHDARGLESRLYSLAYIDQLTGVPNRQKFKEDFETIAAEIAANTLLGVVCIFDLDNFKSINDTYGHNTGDIMLRRLAEHFSSDNAFSGHIYRLGGDEFVLLFSDPVDKYESLAAFRHHYSQLLKSALRTYTLPNIEISCTLSMGVAYFPQHGTTLSDVLRKADIALYKAKAAGRDRIVVFEDKYDNAKKLKDLYINIRPMLTALGRTFGYELIDRGNEGKDDERSVNLTEFNRTLDALGLDDIENNAKYFISYTSHLHDDAVRNNLPKEKFIVQIYLPPTLREGELRAYQRLSAHGYSLSFSGLTSSNATAAVLELGSYFKFAPHGMTPLMQDKMIVHNPGKTFIATNVNSPAEFEAARKRGFKLYEGYYFNEPVVTKKTKEIDPLKVNYYRLLKLSSTTDHVDFKQISSVIASDIALSYKLLKLLNSAAVGLRYRISSIDMAVAYLGEEKLKKWISLLALRGVASDKPLELFRISLIRAQFGELLCPHIRPRRDPKHVFMVGMFSLLHIAFDKTREALLDEMPVADEIRESLLTRNGPYSDLIAFYNNFEYANWEEVSRFAEENGLTNELINDSYVAAVKWYNDLVE